MHRNATHSFTHAWQRCVTGHAWGYGQQAECIQINVLYLCYLIVDQVAEAAQQVMSHRRQSMRNVQSGKVSRPHRTKEEHAR